MFCTSVLAGAKRISTLAIVTLIWALPRAASPAPRTGPAAAPPGQQRRQRVRWTGLRQAARDAQGLHFCGHRAFQARAHRRRRRCGRRLQAGQHFHRVADWRRWCARACNTNLRRCVDRGQNRPGAARRRPARSGARSIRRRRTGNGAGEIHRTFCPGTRPVAAAGGRSNHTRRSATRVGARQFGARLPNAAAAVGQVTSTALAAPARTSERRR